jgi:hypothetical protein
VRRRLSELAAILTPARPRADSVRERWRSAECGSPRHTRTETGPVRGPEPSESSIRDQKEYFIVATNRSSLNEVGVVKSSLSLSQ